MTDYLNYFFIVLGILGIGLLKVMLAKRAKQTTGTYERKQYLMSKAEHELFNYLQQAVGDRYYIFPQINLDKIFLAKGEGRYSHRNRIKQKSVDYLLCEKNYLSPILAIELNDSSHNRTDRIERDIFVNSVFESAHLPLLTIPWQSSYDIETLRSQINEKVALTLKYSTPEVA